MKIYNYYIINYLYFYIWYAVVFSFIIIKLTTEIIDHDLLKQTFIVVSLISVWNYLNTLKHSESSYLRRL